MKIGFVAEPYEESGASGMGYMILELLKNLPIAGKNHEFIIYSSLPIRKDLVLVPVRNVIVPKGLLGKFLWFLRTDEDMDVLLFVTPLLPLVLPRRIKAVPICPELVSQKITPGTFHGKLLAFVRDHILMPICLRRATKIVTISRATMEDIITYYRIPPEKITLIYVGFQDLTPYKDTAPVVEEKIKPYFFFTGRVKPRKNVHAIVSAFIQFKKRTSVDCKLVIAGKAGGDYYRSMIEELAEQGFQDDVFFVGYVSTESLCAYYLHAIALIFPSLNEGFGMPVVEAMNLGTPVITSSISSLPEAAGDAGLLVDPYDIEDISRTMEKVFSDSNLRARMIEKGYIQAKKFSWPKAADAYIRLLHSL